MSSVEFQVSAKTARLIGRENISGVDGAVLELVKNGYDADAECVYIKYDMPFLKVPEELSWTEANEYFGNQIIDLEKYYDVKDGKYVIKQNLEKNEIRELEQSILSLGSIIVLDNGCGMTKDILETTWMNIGTSDKEVNIKSNEKKRIKTGAKGIGRFALDKLSLRSEVVTSNKDDSVYSWKINWTQFDESSLLRDVKAEIDEIGNDFRKIVECKLGDDFKKLTSYNWKTGTMIILSPVRELWNTRLFNKVNRNLQNINPLGSIDKFDIIVDNIHRKELNFKSLSGGIVRDNYDYMIKASYDGKNHVSITLDRNEIDIEARTATVEIKDFLENEKRKLELDMNEFWARDSFIEEKHRRKDFNGEQEYKYTLKELLPKEKDEVLPEYEKIGSFELQLYYMKNESSTTDIIRKFNKSDRKRILSDFPGIKIYRDKFKVSPYGDEGAFYDWLNLSERVQNSPAAASHKTGNWRVSPNQIIGSVSISRITNPNLMDTANREGMQINQQYLDFIRLIQAIISKFEYDRQYPLREFAIWTNEKKAESEGNLRKVYEQVMMEKKQQQEQSKKKSGNESDGNASKRNEEKKKEDKDYSEEDLKDVIYSMGKKQDNDLKTEQILSVLSSAGVMAQTFAHEISRIATNLGCRGQHIEESVNRILDYKPYIGDEDFNPYDLIAELDDTDLLLSEWVNLIMDSVNKENFYSKEVKLKEFLLQTKRKWSRLLETKYICIKEIICDEDIALKLPLIDLHLILNNFLLNSAYFLEECYGERYIEFEIYQKDGKIYMDMKNNGPRLDEAYRQNPDEILNATVSSKEKGTGLGLWIAREAVTRNLGTLHVKDIADGFMLQASWKK